MCVCVCVTDSVWVCVCVCLSVCLSVCVCVFERVKILRRCLSESPKSVSAARFSPQCDCWVSFGPAQTTLGKEKNKYRESTAQFLFFLFFLYVYLISKYDSGRSRLRRGTRFPTRIFQGLGEHKQKIETDYSVYYCPCFYVKGGAAAKTPLPKGVKVTANWVNTTVTFCPPLSLLLQSPHDELDSVPTSWWVPTTLPLLSSSSSSWSEKVRVLSL